MGKLCALAAVLAISVVFVDPALASGKRVRAAAPPRASAQQDTGVAEARLITIYRLIGQAQNRQALNQAAQLVQDYPNFQLAQLVYGDLLLAQTRPINALGDVPADMAKGAGNVLDDLREESRKRMEAVRERPPPGMVPVQFLELSQRTRHAIAVDAARSRLYLFENTPGGMKLLADYYISLGKAGIAKTVEGDQRTPLGIYYITSTLDPRNLKDIYGSGALPLSYPNILDVRRGKTGSGIWLHGMPTSQFARAPQSTDGCVAMSNPDLLHVLRTVEIRSTPVVIAPKLQWETQSKIRVESKPFAEALMAWRQAKSAGDMRHLATFYAPDFDSNGKSLEQWLPVLRQEVAANKGRAVELKDVSYLRWVDSVDTMVVTFGEVTQGTRTGSNKRQYWMRQGNQWKIFFEGPV